MNTRYIIMNHNVLWTEKIFMSEDDAYSYIIKGFIDTPIDIPIGILKNLQSGKMKIIKMNLNPSKDV